MRRKHLESVSSRSLSVRGSWGAAPSVFWYGVPGGTQGPLGKGGAAERWRVTPSVSGVTRHGAQPATTHTSKRTAPPARRTGRHPAVTLRRRRRLQTVPRRVGVQFMPLHKAPPPGDHQPALNSHNKSQFLFPSKIHYLCNIHPAFPHNVNFPLKKVKY